MSAYPPFFPSLWFPIVLFLSFLKFPFYFTLLCHSFSNLSLMSDLLFIPFPLPFLPSVLYSSSVLSSFPHIGLHKKPSLTFPLPPSSLSPFFHLHLFPFLSFPLHLPSFPFLSFSLHLSCTFPSLPLIFLSELS